MQSISMPYSVLLEQRQDNLSSNNLADKMAKIIHDNGTDAKQTTAPELLPAATQKEIEVATKEATKQ